MEKTAQSQLDRGKSSKKLGVQGFTLVELLVVIAIIAILAAIVVLIINPLELTRRGRDAARLTDLANLQTAINVAAQEATNGGVAILCVGATETVATPGTPLPDCIGNTNDNSANVRKADGTGWVRVNLSAQKSVSVPTLPIDPINDTTYHYTYSSDGESWEINAALESDQQKPKMLDVNDGGDSDTKYEVGSSLTLQN